MKKKMTVLALTLFGAGVLFAQESATNIQNLTPQNSSVKANGTSNGLTTFTPKPKTPLMATFRGIHSSPRLWMFLQGLAKTAV